MNLPRMLLVRQKFHNPPLEDLSAAVTGEMDILLGENPPPENSRVAVTAGSRGISGLSTILRTIIEELKKRDLRPFVVAAMGSHGGSTNEGKLRVLEAAGITAATMGVPVVSSLKVKKIGETPAGLPVFLDAEAALADRILLVNRVHPHPSFEAPIQSGMMKMLCVGLGNRPGAETAHRHGVRHGLGKTILAMAQKALDLLPILGGFGIIENENGESALVKGIPARHLEKVERTLLQKCLKMRPRIPFRSIHLLIVDRMGKNIAGTGMDPRVIGRLAERRPARDPDPGIARIYVRSLTPESGGNGHGVGLADFVHRRLADAIDWQVTRANSLSASAPEKCRLPLVVDSDRMALEAAFLTCGPIEESGPRIVRIQDTGHLRDLWISEALLEEAGAHPHLEILKESSCPEFDRDGMLV